jgi:hypothetical protein
MTDIRFRPVLAQNITAITNPAILIRVQQVMNDHLQRAITKGQTYPPPPPKTGKRQYKRTYVLRNSWRFTPAHVSGDTIRASASNTATDKRGRHYASRVFGSSQYEQTAIHQGRWPTKDQLLDRAAYLADIEAAVHGGQ